MNSIKKARCLDTFPRARKRNSTGNQCTSQNTHGSQRRATLLKNNKSLAITLQETRCELSVYKNFYEECLECMHKVQLAKSRMMQFSTTLKSLVQEMDENITLLDFDESKWLNIRPPVQSNKNFQNGMNPVTEVCNEVLEEDSADQEMNCNQKNNPEYSEQMVQDIHYQSVTLEKTADAQKCTRINKSPRKCSENVVEANMPLENNSGARGNDGNEGTIQEIPKFSKNGPNQNSHQNPLPSLSSQAIKTKIPRCQPLSINLKRQHFGKDSEQSNKTSKRKSPEKEYEQSDHNFSRRKTFVVKSSNVLKNPESIENLPDSNEPHLTENFNKPEDGLVSSNDKRKTFVLKSSNITKETEPDYSSKIDKEFVPKCQDHENKISDVESLLSSEKNKRKTFVKKSNDNTALHQNDEPVNQESFPIRECAINLERIENCEDNDQSKSKKSCFDFPHSETLTDTTTIKDIQISVESPNKIKENSTDNLHNVNISDVLSKEIRVDDKISATNEADDMQKTEKIAENSKSKVDCDVPDQTAANDMEKDFEIMNEEVVISDKSQKVENVNEIPEYSSFKTPNSLLESSDSELDLMIIDEIGYNNQSAFQTTPVRRRIPRSSRKKKNFVFNKRKSVFKNQLSNEILNSKINNCCQKNTDTSLSDMNTVNNREVDINIIRQGNDVIAETNANSIKSSSQANTVRKKNKKTSGKKIEGDQDKLIKNTKKNSTKVKKIKNVKKNESDIEIDDLISKPKKGRKKKKNEDINGDDVISKFVEVDKDVKLKEVKGTGKKLESDYPCKKTGKNTFLVQAEIHPPPPSSNTSYDKIIKKVDDQNFQNRQLAVVLDDVLKSKDIEHLNISNRDILESNISDSVKFPFSDSSSNFVIDPEESIEKLRCDSVPETDYCNLNCDEILDNGSSKVPNNPVLNTEKYAANLEENHPIPDFPGNAVEFIF